MSRRSSSLAPGEQADRAPIRLARRASLPFRQLWSRLVWTARLRVAPRAAAAIALMWFAALAIVERVRTTWRRLRGRRPRLIWGPSAILNTKYWSESLRERGYDSTTCVVMPPTPMVGRGDFDVTRDDLIERSSAPRLLREYAMFAWALPHGDVFLMHFDGGFLRGTPLERVEFALMRLAGKKLVFSPYGGDIAVPGHLGAIEEAVLSDYPDLPEQAELTARRVLRSLKWADASILTIQPGFQPKFNVLWANQLAIDTELWPNRPPSDADGRDDAVSVVHAPNHREIKGTAHLERAVEALTEEGLKVELVVMEGRPNREVREAILACDIVADQFLLGYGLLATEGMAAGKPVLSNMSNLPAGFGDDEQMRACPIVDANPATLLDDLRRLVTNPELRRQIGAASREYVMRHHSYDAVGRDWAAIVDHVWSGAPLPPHLSP